MTSRPVPTIRIMHADDHAIIRNGTRNSLAVYPEIECIGEAENGMDLLQQLELKQPDIILLDLSMPIMDGLETLPILKKRYPGIKVIIFSMHNDPSIICRMMALGANAYITLGATSAELYEAITACHKNEFFINEYVTKAMQYMAELKHQMHGIEPAFFISLKELRILRLMKAGLNREEIADDVDLSPRTVESILDRLKSKTKTNSVTQLIAYAVKNNIIET